MAVEGNAINFQQSFGEMLNQIQCGNDIVDITEDRWPVAALVDAKLFARIRRMRDRTSRRAERFERNG